MSSPGPEPAGLGPFEPAPDDRGVGEDPEAAAEAGAEGADEWDPSVGNTYVGGIESDPDLALGDEDWWAAMAEAYTYGRFKPSPGSREAGAFARFDACARADAEWLTAFIREQHETGDGPEAGE
jgi:hypothetical protein